MFKKVSLVVSVVVMVMAFGLGNVWLMMARWNALQPITRSWVSG